jgi:hypothetical protein
LTEVEARKQLRVVHRFSGFVGTVVGIEQGSVKIRNAAGHERLFRLGQQAFLVEGKPATLVPPKPKADAAAARTASGSVAIRTGARVAQTSRILVEGVHDAELVEKVWGDNLRVEGVVVERLDGVDVLSDIVRDFQPGPGRRLGVLVDHLVDGSKEARIAASVRHPHVLVTGTPFIDIWQAVKPMVAGIDAWPDVPRGEPWKEGTIRRLGLKMESGPFWKQLLARVTSYADLEPALVGAVEQLIDFVCE